MNSNAIILGGGIVALVVQMYVWPKTLHDYRGRFLMIGFVSVGILLGLVLS